MKITLSALLFFFIPFLFSQTWQVTSIPANEGGQRYDDVFFLNENVGWAASGYFAAVYKTEDGGITWSEQINETELGSDLYFRNIEFIDEKIGFLGTLNGKFYRTMDGGSSWNLITITPNPPAICGLDTAGENTIYGCGAYFTPAFVIKSVDKGETWQFIDMGSYANALVEIKFLTETIGYAAGTNTEGACILKTTDGGDSWSEIYNSGISGQYVWKLQLLYNNPGIIFGSVDSFSPNPGMLIKSSDSGTTWTERDAPEFEIQAVGFISESTGWMGGHNTGIFETTNGGITWKNLNIGSNLNKFFIIDNAHAFASGTSVYKFTDQSLGIEDEVVSTSNHLKFRLENNPVNSDLNFSIDYPSTDKVLIELFDIKGRFIRQLELSEVTHESTVLYSFKVHDLSAGNYILLLHNNYDRQSIQFIKE